MQMWLENRQQFTYTRNNQKLLRINLLGLYNIRQTGIDLVVCYSICSRYVFFKITQKRLNFKIFGLKNLLFVIHFEFVYQRDEMIVIA